MSKIRTEYFRLSNLIHSQKLKEVAEAIFCILTLVSVFIILTLTTGIVLEPGINWFQAILKTSLAIIFFLGLGFLPVLVIYCLNQLKQQFKKYKK